MNLMPKRMQAMPSAVVFDINERLCTSHATNIVASRSWENCRLPPRLRALMLRSPPFEHILLQEGEHPGSPPISSIPTYGKARMDATRAEVVKVVKAT